MTQNYQQSLCFTVSINSINNSSFVRLEVIWIWNRLLLSCWILSMKLEKVIMITYKLFSFCALYSVLRRTCSEVVSSVKCPIELLETKTFSKHSASEETVIVVFGKCSSKTRFYWNSVKEGSQQIKRCHYSKFISTESLNIFKNTTDNAW